jgi:uncharacterized protein
MDEWTLLLAGMAGFAAGLLDSIVGGGGLILTPAMLNLFPETAILQLIATQRTSSIMGTSVAAWNYFRHVKLPLNLVLLACCGALLASIVGALLAQRMDSEVLKWVILGMCVLLAIYTFVRKDLGKEYAPRFIGKPMLVASVLVGLCTGFYNGLIGPGTGILMVFAFVSVIGLDFLRASAISKVANVSADLSSWTVLMLAGLVMWGVVLPLVVGNMLGSWLGSHLAILKGSRFIRTVFLLVVVGLIARVVWDLS